MDETQKELKSIETAEALENKCIEDMTLNALTDINELEKELIKILSKKEDINNITAISNHLHNTILGLFLKLNTRQNNN